MLLKIRKCILEVFQGCFVVDSWTVMDLRAGTLNLDSPTSQFFPLFTGEFYNDRCQIKRQESF